MRTLACWDCGFESCRRHGCLSVVSVVCCQVEVCSSTGLSPVQSSSTGRGMSECDRETSYFEAITRNGVEALRGRGWGGGGLVDSSCCVTVTIQLKTHPPNRAVYCFYKSMYVGFVYAFRLLRTTSSGCVQELKGV